MSISPFHLAIPVNDLEETKDFYLTLFDTKVGRETSKWVDFDFYGHQLSVHLKPEETSLAHKNIVDGKNVPVRHFGIVLDWNVWQDLSAKLKYKELEFIIDPYIRFEGEDAEQATMFLLDPSGNALEFKSFKNKDNLFSKTGSYG